MKKIVVVGQGYVGLPVAMRAVEVGFDVVGIDIDQRRVDSLVQGTSFVGDISDEELRRNLATGRYLPTINYEDVADFDFGVITVPTPLKEGLPDLSYITDAAEALAKFIKPGSTVILESTTHPGTTEEIMVPILEVGSGLKAETDFFVGYSPERIDPGNKTWGFVETPKVVSGLGPKSLIRVKELYDELVDRTVPVGTPKEAEMTKLLENTFRHVNIALVNELAIYAHGLGINLWESIEAASTKPFGFMKFVPGPGVGGHCLPVDPSYLSWHVKRQLGHAFRFVELANDVNDHMPDYVVRRLIMTLNDIGKPMRGSRILLVGLAYKKNTGDVREAPSLRIIKLLDEFGALVLAADDLVEDHHWPAGLKRTSLDSENVRSSDAIVLVTDHDYFDLSVLGEHEVPTLDTKNVLKGDFVERL
ncbi:nucleotide sugar dehydrogenase [Pseudarthrobacter sp. AL07]|nr:nucleotide sugar dehydrogenase [Pseudarthrobacter sp. AL07]MDI3210057.1 nucleotide sugar dehydrogenase [Pseudarthrobacter sp. AL07]